MALEDMKIKEKDFIGKDVSSLPVNPSADGMGAVELQAAFDRAVKEVIVPKFNALLEEMPHLTKLLASTELTSEDFLHYANDTNTGFTISALLELSRQHRASMENPHAVTKEQIGLGKVDNTADKDKPASDAVKNEIKLASDGLQAQINGVQEDLRNKASLIEPHRSDINNPHKVTKEQVGLGNVDNTSDLNKPVSTAVQAALDNLYETKIKPVEAGGNLEPRVSSLEKQVADNKSACDQKLTSIDSRVEFNRKSVGELKSLLSTSISEVNDMVASNKGYIEAYVRENIDNVNKNIGELQAETDQYVHDTVNNHASNKSNPHKVTAEQVGLGNISSRVDALERQLPRVMTKAAFDVLPEKDASVVYILT